jgi:lipoyl-dependent peroxiredoxin
MRKITRRFATSVTVTGGRDGHAVSDDGVLDVQLRLPKLNGVAEGTNPEQLFGAAWGACLQSALIAVARNSGDDVTGSTVRLEIAQGPADDGGYGLAAKIAIELPGVERGRAESLVAQAHELCPYSNAVRGNIEVDLSVD